MLRWWSRRPSVAPSPHACLLAQLLNLAPLDLSASPTSAPFPQATIFAKYAEQVAEVERELR